MTSNEKLELMLRETTHQCANDLQLVTSLLHIQSRNASNADVRQALNEAADRVAILAEARDRTRKQKPSLETALQHVCAALNSQAEPRSILVSLQFATNTDGLSDDRITCIALCVNELATNAIKHAFQDRQRGKIEVRVDVDDDDMLIITVTDDGPPGRTHETGAPYGMGLSLVRGLLRSVGGTLIEPTSGSKTFEIVLGAGSVTAGIFPLPRTIESLDVRLLSPTDEQAGRWRQGHPPSERTSGFDHIGHRPGKSVNHRLPAGGNPADITLAP